MHQKVYIQIRLGCFLLMAAFLSACIENDVPYPYIKLFVTGTEIDGQIGSAVISNDDRTVTVNLEDTVNMKKVRVKSISVTEGGRCSLPDDTIIDLSNPYPLTLSLYQDYQWTLKANQTIERRFTVEHQVGAATFDEKEHFASVNISTKDFLWTTAFMISYNNNKIKELYDGKQDVNKTLFVGRPIGQFYLLKSEGIWQTNEAAEAAKYNARPGDRKILDSKKDYVINGEDRDFCGVSTPKYYGSFTNTFSYKGIDLTAFFTFAGGHKINNSLNRYLNSFNVWGNMSENYYKYYWRQDRPNNKYPAPRVGSAYANGDGTDANLQKGDYLRLRNLEIAVFASLLISEVFFF